MTTAQPGQEQRMVTDAMIEAGADAYHDAVLKARGIRKSRNDGYAAEGRERIAPEDVTFPIDWLAQVYAAMEAARPTADLGDDGELVRRLRRTRGEFVRTLVNPDGPEAADRLILYREALERCQWQLIETAPKDGTRVIALEADGDVVLADWDDGRWYLSLAHDPIEPPTHWMPLPKQPAVLSRSGL